MVGVYTKFGTPPRGTAWKVPVFGLLKRGGRVYTLLIPNAKAKTSMPILESWAIPGRIVYRDSFTSYDVIDVATFHHRRIGHAKAFAKGKENERHTGGIENPRNRAKRRLRRSAASRECEWRTRGGTAGASSWAAGRGQEGRVA